MITCYLADDTDPDDVERGFREGVFTGVKLYPANATTNSAAGVTDYKKVMRVLERMEKIDMPFLMHGEDVDPEIDIFDREARFIERYLQPWTKRFPGLRMILEHLSSKEGVDYVKSAAPQVGGTITPYHMRLTRTDWFGWGLKPYMYVMPVIKTASDRDALRKAATSGEACYFLGTDSAPHPVAKKLALNGIPGIFNAPVAIETYAKVFEEEGALDKLEAFASLNGPRHYKLPPNEERITLEKVSWTAPEEIKVAGPDEKSAGLSRRRNDRVAGGSDCAEDIRTDVSVGGTMSEYDVVRGGCWQCGVLRGAGGAGAGRQGGDAGGGAGG